MKRSWLYKKDEEPKIFKGEDDIQEALADGWVDSPADIEEAETDVRESEVSLTEELDGYDNNMIITTLGEIKHQCVKRGLDIVTPLSEYTDTELILMLEEVEAECIKRGIGIEKVTPHDIDGDGEGDVDLNDLSDDELKKLLDERNETYPHNIGREKLLERFSKPE